MHFVLLGLLIGFAVHAADDSMVSSATHDPESVSRMHYHYWLPFDLFSQCIAMEDAEKVAILLRYGKDQGWDDLNILDYLLTHISPVEFNAYRLCVGGPPLIAKLLAEEQDVSST